MTSSWDDGEDPGGARRSCGGTKVYRSGLEKIGAEHHRRTENGVTAGVERGQRRPTRQGGVDQRSAEQRHRSSGEKEKGKKKKRQQRRGGGG
jgi:hypothetical protein